MGHIWRADYFVDHLHRVYLDDAEGDARGKSLNLGGVGRGRASEVDASQGTAGYPSGYRKASDWIPNCGIHPIGERHNSLDVIRLKPGAKKSPAPPEGAGHCQGERRLLVIRRSGPPGSGRPAWLASDCPSLSDSSGKKSRTRASSFSGPCQAPAKIRNSIHRIILKISPFSQKAASRRRSHDR